MWCRDGVSDSNFGYACRRGSNRSSKPCADRCTYVPNDSPRLPVGEVGVWKSGFGGLVGSAVAGGSQGEIGDGTIGGMTGGAVSGGGGYLPALALPPFGGHGLCGLLSCRGVGAVLHLELDRADLAEG